MTKKTTATLILAVGATLASPACNEGMRRDRDEPANTNVNPRPDEPQAQPQAQQAQPQAAQQNQGASVRSVADISGNPEHFVGEKVVVQGDVEEVHEGHGFRLDDESPLRGGIDDDLLVIGAKEASWKVDDGWDSTQVRVEGTIRRVKDVDLTKELGRPLDTKLEDAVEDEQLVLIAENVQRISREAR